jgi:hypothetical protein
VPEKTKPEKTKREKPDIMKKGAISRWPLFLHPRSRWVIFIKFAAVLWFSHCFFA